MREKKATIDNPITTICGYSHAGEGVGRFKGKPVFIPLAARGETVRFEITEEKKDFLRGKLLEIIEPASWTGVRQPIDKQKAASRMGHGIQGIRFQRRVTRRFVCLRDLWRRDGAVL